MSGPARQLRIAVLVPASIPPNAEAELYNLGRMVGGKFKLDLITGPGTPPPHIDELYSIHCTDIPSQDIAGLRFAFQALDRYLKKHTPDLLLNLIQPFPLGVAVIIQGKRYGVPTLLRVTGNFLREAMLYDHPLERAKQYLTHNVILPWVYRRADQVVPIGPNLADDLVSAGFPEEKVQAMYQPFDARTFTPVAEDKRRELKRRLGLDPTKKAILFAGRIGWEKGADRLQTIIEKVLSRSKRFQFCLVGEGPSRGQFAKYDAGVLLPGFVPHEDIHKYFQAADLLVHPSRSEGLPHVVLEALACKTPVMASPVGEIDTVLSVTSGEPEDYVEYILADNWTVDSLPDQLGWEEQARAYAELLQGVATGEL